MSKYIILSEKYAGLYSVWKTYIREDPTPLFIPTNPHVDYRLSGHTDLSVFKLSNSELLCANYLKNTDIFDFLQKNGIKIRFDETEQGSVYPTDCALNCVTAGNDLICNPKAASPTILHYYSALNYNVIPVKQSYVKCSLCKAGEHAVITSDKGIQKTLEHSGYEILYVDPACINLEGYSNGFIGGASFLIDNVLYFTGSFDTETDEKIAAFAQKHHIETVFLSDRRPADIGSAVVI